MDILSSSSKRIHEPNLELLRARFAGKFCIAFICAAQFLPRLLIVFTSSLSSLPELLILVSVPFLALMVSVITADYADYVDIALLLLWTGDWVFAVMGSLLKVTDTDPPYFEITSIYGFTNFSWKTLLVTLIAQKWQLKIIPPVVTSVLSSAYAIYYTPNNLFSNIVRSVFQVLNIVVILYCEDKIKWSMIWKNLQQEKWMQVNNFILNNIPENIMILDVKGEIQFISDYCKSFMKKCGHMSEENTKDLFGKIRDLHQQLYETTEADNSVVLQVDKQSTHNEPLYENNLTKVQNLESLITNLNKMIEDKNIQEKQFFMYNGKLKIENRQQNIEIKISFIKHFSNNYIILIFRDTTQRDLLVTLEDTNKYKDQLLASVSHELRAPLNGNINLVEAAVNSSQVPDQIKQSLLTPALRSGKFLLHIINDILDMSQIKHKKLRLVFRCEDLKETLKSAAQLVEFQAKKKGLELMLELDPKLPVSFCTDHMRLSQIVLNLLSNAIKFTEEGTVKLRAMAEGTSCVRIIVEDTGIGIRKENLHKLFSSDTHIEFRENQALNPTGVGLGLNIASNLADLLAPKNNPGINVSSVFNQGSAFSFTIENKQANSAQSEKYHGLDESSSGAWCEIPEELPNNLPPTSRPLIQKNDSSVSMSPLLAISNETVPCLCPKVLIVDDNPFNTMAFETILSSLKIKCESVYSGSACLKKLSARQEKKCGKSCRSYSVIFMDQEMPEMTGSETVVEIRRLQKESLVPEMKIIGCTAHKAKEEVDRFFESGLDQCIFKPISVMMIREILKEILSG